MIPFDQIEAVRQASDLVDIASGHCTLKPSGANHTAVCPFHREKTPSFYIFPDSQRYKCFGCQASGDVFGFVMAVENIDFPDAVRMLADRAGITLDETREGGGDRPARDDVNRLADATAFANNLFQQVLLRDRTRGEPGRSYLKARGLDAELAKEWELGFAPAEWTFVLDHATKAGYSIDVLKEAGLVSVRDGKPPIDRFRGRVMFPIHDTRHRVVGFGGRAVESDDKAKYINSSEGPLYHKSKVLYGLEQVHRARRENPEVREQPIYVAEGYLDVMGLHGAGLKTAVAPCGTSLTADHVKLLRPNGRPVVLVFDGDAAGMKAARNALAELVRQGVEGRVVTVPKGRDPYDIYLDDGADALKKLVHADRPGFDFMLDSLKTQYGDSVDGRATTVQALASLFGQTPDRVKEDLYIKRAAFELAANERSVRAAWEDAKPMARRAERDEIPEARARRESLPLSRDAKAERDLVIAIVSDPETAAEAAKQVALGGIDGTEARLVAGVAFEIAGSGTEVTGARILDRLRQLGQPGAVAFANQAAAEGLDRRAQWERSGLERERNPFKELMVGYCHYLEQEAYRDQRNKLLQEEREARASGDHETAIQRMSEILDLDRKRHLDQKD